MNPDPFNALMSNVSNNGLVVPVEPSDLKAVWKVVEEMRGQRDSDEHIAIDARMYANACSPGANVLAVWYRVSMLSLIAMRTGLFAPGLPDAAKEAACNVAASFPMKMIGPEVNEGMPLDAEAFVKQIQDELGRLGLESK